MKSDEAIRILKWLREQDPKESWNIQQKEVIDAAIKNTPIRVMYESDGYSDGNPVYDMARCPRCEKLYYECEDSQIWENARYCPECGQALLWGEGEEE